MGEDALTAPMVEFVPGDATGLVGRTAIALIEAAPSVPMVLQLWETIETASELGELTELLVGEGIRGLPSLAVAVLGADSVRILTRGGIVASVTTLDGVTERIDAGDVTTWVEHAVVNPRLVELHRIGESAMVGGFRVDRGVVPAGYLRLDCVAGRHDTMTPQDADAVPNVVGSSVLPARSTEATDATDAGVEQADVERAGAVELPTALEQPMIDEQPIVEEQPIVDEDEGLGSMEADHDLGSPTMDVDVAESETADPVEPPNIQEEQPPSGASSTVRYEPDTDWDVDPVVEPDVDDTNDDGDVVDAGDVGDPGDAEFDHLFGATEHRPVSSAGVSEPDSAGDSGDGGGLISAVPSGAVGASMPADGGDHDGMTISLAQLRAAQGQQAGDVASPSSGGSPDATFHSEVVHAVSCPAGHLNPPVAAVCRVCGVEVAVQEHVSVPRPVMGTLRFSDGTERPLVRSMLIGRSPNASGTLNGEQLPELVTLESPSKELSGTHLEVRLEGWQVLVIDRRSTNGTMIRLPGRDPQRLHPGNAVPIVPGTVIDMAEEVQFTYEVDS